MYALSDALQEIENELDAGTHRSGTWGAFLRAASHSTREQRIAVADHVSRVSDKLHLQDGRRALSFKLGITMEALAAVIGVFLLTSGLGRASNALVFASAVILVFSLQPLVKISVGQALGIRYSYAYLWGGELCFKMRYGTYLAASRGRRVLFHLSDTVGSPLALWIVSSLTAGKLMVTSSICMDVFWVMVCIEVILFVAGIIGLQRLARLARVTSAGLAGHELRGALMD